MLRTLAWGATFLRKLWEHFFPTRRTIHHIERFNRVRRAKRQTMRDCGMSGKQFRNMRKQALRRIVANERRMAQQG